MFNIEMGEDETIIADKAKFCVAVLPTGDLFIGTKTDEEYRGDVYTISNARMINMHRINLTLVFFLIFTIITSAMAYYIMIRAYDVFADIDESTYNSAFK